MVSVEEGNRAETLTKIIDSALYLVLYNLCIEIVEFIIASNKIFSSIKKKDKKCTDTLLRSTQFKM